MRNVHCGGWVNLNSCDESQEFLLCGPRHPHKGKMKIVLQFDFDVHVQPNVLALLIDDGYESNEVFKKSFNSIFQNSID
jgi:uncharacterized protein YciI